MRKGTEEYKQMQSDKAMKAQLNRKGSNAAERYSNVAAGWIEIGDRRLYVRSSWEANFCAYLEFLKNQKHIKDWLYEPKTFIFHEILRGIRSYCPDFQVFNNDGSDYYVEVKGYMDPKSKTKISRMAKYYPEVRLDVVDAKRYRAISAKSDFIPNWGLLKDKKGK